VSDNPPLAGRFWVSTAHQRFNSAPTRASTFAAPSSWQRSAAPCRSPRVLTASCSPPAHDRDTSRLPASPHSPANLRTTSGSVARPPALRGLPAPAGFQRRVQAGCARGSTRDTRKPAVDCVDFGNKAAYLQTVYGSDGTRTRDLRRGRPVRGREMDD